MNNDYLTYLYSSINSAIITKTTVAPLERIKLLKQVQTYYTTTNYNSFLGSLKYIYKNEGFKGYFKGNLTNIYRILPGYTIRFPLNDIYKNYLKKQTNQKKLFFNQLLFIGIFTGLHQVILTYPLDLMRTRISLDKNMSITQNSILNCGKNIYKKEGLTAFYKGFSISVLTAPIYIGLQLSIYDYSKNYIYKDYYYTNKIMAGITAGIIAQSLMFPGDTIKRQLQINGFNGTVLKYKNLRGCIKYIYKNTGIRGFYPGFFINFIKAIPEVSIQFIVYDYSKDFLKQKFK